MKSEHLAAVQNACNVELGILPSAGGFHEQPAAFVKAYPLIMREVTFWRSKSQELAIKKAQQKKR